MSAEVGCEAPHFSLLTCNGKRVSLDDFSGKNVVLYFYPKDDTPGCTQEALDFKQNILEFEKLDTVIIGLSKDNVKSHNNFKTRYELPFMLLSDEDASVIKSYDVWMEKSMFGKKYMGINRSTFLIDKNGLIKQIWRNVKVKDHVQKILEFLRSDNA